MNVKDDSPDNDLENGTGQNHAAPPPPTYQQAMPPPLPISIPSVAVSPQTTHQTPHPTDDDSTPKVNLVFARKFCVICSPIALSASILASILLLPMILRAIYDKSNYDRTYAEQATSLMYKIFGSIIGVFGVLTFLSLFAAFSKNNYQLLQLYTAYHYLTDTIVLMAVIAFFVSGEVNRFWLITVGFIIFFIVFFIFTNYTHWQVTLLRKSQKSSTTSTDVVTYQLGQGARTYGMVMPDYGIPPPAYPGTNLPESRPHSRVGNWVQSTNLA